MGNTVIICAVYYVLGIITVIAAAGAFIAWCYFTKEELPPIIDEHDPGYDVTEEKDDV